MTLDEFVFRGWQEHAIDTPGVWARLPEGIALVTEAADLPALAALAVHVSGEHLGLWDEGIAFLLRLQALPFCDSRSTEGKALARGRAVLQRCKGDFEASERSEEAARTGGDVPVASDRIRVLAAASAALAGRGRTAEAIRDWREAVALAGYGPAKVDPAARALAVTGNNLAVTLEEKPARTSEERELMVEAATAARRFWEIAGTWREVTMAEYRLARSLMEAGAPAAALEHAAACLAIVEANPAGADQIFFAREVMARAALATGDRAAALTHRDHAERTLETMTDQRARDYAKGELAKLDLLSRT